VLEVSERASTQALLAAGEMIMYHALQQLSHLPHLCLITIASQRRASHRAEHRGGSLCIRFFPFSDQAVRHLSAKNLRQSAGVPLDRKWILGDTKVLFNIHWASFLSEDSHTGFLTGRFQGVFFLLNLR